MRQRGPQKWRRRPQPSAYRQYLQHCGNLCRERHTKWPDYIVCNGHWTATVTHNSVCMRLVYYRTVRDKHQKSPAAFENLGAANILSAGHPFMLLLQDLQKISNKFSRCMSWRHMELCNNPVQIYIQYPQYWYRLFFSFYRFFSPQLSWEILGTIHINR